MALLSVCYQFLTGLILNIDADEDMFSVYGRASSHSVRRTLHITYFFADWDLVQPYIGKDPEVNIARTCYINLQYPV